MEELLIFTMDKFGMAAEVADICEQHQIKTDVHTFYLSEALLKMKFKDKFYLDVL